MYQHCFHGILPLHRLRVSFAKLSRYTHTHTQIFIGPGEMAQILRVLTSLLGDPGSVPLPT